MTDGKIMTELRDTWESAAPGWAKWEAIVATGLLDATDAMLDMAGVEKGMRVLDIACGAGSQSLRAAERVGPTGRVLASDISATMLAHVREAARRNGLDNVETLECAAEDLPEQGYAFDAAICRLGLMLFPAPGRALEAVRRVLRPGARFAGLVFTIPANNKFMSVPMQILLRHAGKEPPPPGKPGIFALGGPGVLESLLVDSGFADVETRVVTAALRVPSAEVALEMMREAFGAYRAVVADLDPDARAAAWEDIRACLGQFENDQGFRAELEFMIGSGTAAA